MLICTNKHYSRRRAATIDKKLVTEVLSNPDEEELESKLDQLGLIFHFII